MRPTPMRGRWPTPARARTCSSGCRPRARSSPRWSRRWPRSRSSSPWPIRIRKSGPEDAMAVRPDAIIATGRSDYPNQVNNVLGFPFIFRGALDVRATAINEEMKIAAAEALAALAREPVPGRSRRGLWRAGAELRPRLHHPGAVRSAADGGRRLGCRRSRGPHRGRPKTDRGPRRLSPGAARPAQSDRRR